jgi:hypothetical protein
MKNNLAIAAVLALLVAANCASPAQDAQAQTKPAPQYAKTVAEMKRLLRSRQTQ